MRTLNVHLLPSHVAPDELAGRHVVVIDVLRATTTICHALVAGAKQIIPREDIAQARATAEKFDSGEVLLGGEREGIRIDGFDLGNSPRDYRAETVGGKTIVFTTTNGTRAIARAVQAEAILIGALNNVAAIAKYLESAQHVSILCAGTQGNISAEDVFAAGAIANELQGAASDQTMGNTWSTNDEARIALSVYGDGTQAMQVLRESRGGQNLIRLKYHADIEVAAQFNALEVVPRMQAEGAITANE